MLLGSSLKSTSLRLWSIIVLCILSVSLLIFWLFVNHRAPSSTSLHNQTLSAVSRPPLLFPQWSLVSPSSSLNDVQQERLLQQEHLLTHLTAPLDPKSLNIDRLDTFPPTSTMCLRMSGVSPKNTHLAFAYLWNQSPEFAWPPPPKNTKSLAFLLFDPSFPTPSDALWMNDPERSPPALIQRRSFYHWVLADLSPHIHRLSAQIGGVGVRLKGKAFGRLPHGISGVNDYTHWFKTPFIKGIYGGYDGPCFPWNDPEQRHPITGVVFALKLPSLHWLNDQPLTAQDLIRSITGHIIGYTRRRWAVETPMISSTLKD